MTKHNAVIGIYTTHTKSEEAIKELQRAGFDMKKLSIVGKDYHSEEHVIGYYNAGDRMKVWGKLGAFWGGFWGLSQPQSARSNKDRGRSMVFRRAATGRVWIGHGNERMNTH